MSTSVQELTKANFDAVIASGKVVVDFWAPWCGPCRVQGPIIDQLAEHADGDLVVAKVNVDEEPDLAGRFGIQSIPTVMVFDSGTVKSSLVGIHSEQDIRAQLV